MELTSNVLSCPSKSMDHHSVSLQTSIMNSKAKMLRADLCHQIQLHGESHFAVVDALNSLGVFYRHVAQRDDRALAYHEKALRLTRLILQKKFSTRGVQLVATTLLDIAHIKELRGESDKALDMHNEALQLFRSIQIDEKDPRVFSSKRACRRMSAGFTPTAA